MNLINELNEEQIGLLKEADIKIENKDYDIQECKSITHRIVEHIMFFGKDNFERMTEQYESVINKLNKV